MPDKRRRRGPEPEVPRTVLVEVPIEGGVVVVCSCELPPSRPAPPAAPSVSFALPRRLPFIMASTLEIRAPPEDDKLPLPPPPAPPASATRWSPPRRVLAIAAAVFAVAALGIGLGLGLAYKNYLQQQARLTRFNFRGVTSLALAVPRSGRRLATTSTSAQLFGLSADGTTSVLATPPGILVDIIGTPSNATVMVYSSQFALILDSGPCLLAYVPAEGTPICMQRHGLDCIALIAQPGGSGLSNIQFSPAGDVYFSCYIRVMESGSTLKMFSAATHTTTVVYSYDISDYALGAWAVINDASAGGAILAGLYEKNTPYSPVSMTALIGINGSETVVYSKQPLAIIQTPNTVFISYQNDGLFAGKIYLFDLYNITGFETAQPLIGVAADDPAYVWQTVMQFIGPIGVNYRLSALLESGHTIATAPDEVLTSPPPIFTPLSGVTAAAFGMTGETKCSVLLECVLASPHARAKHASQERPVPF